MPRGGVFAVTCRDCGRAWSYDAGELEWYHGKGYVPPKRCRDCREHRRRSAKAVERDRLVGTVTAVRDERGFGFIRGSGGDEYFVRLCDVAFEALPLRIGDMVTFIRGVHASGSHPRAISVRAASVPSVVVTPPGP